MPSSDFNVIPSVMKWLMDIQPRSVMDVGCGFGKWGMLVKDYVGLALDKNIQVWEDEGKVPVSLYGVEVRQEYIKQLQREIYDDIYIGSVIDYIGAGKQADYDCVLMMDVVEHLTKTDAYAVMKHFVDHCGALIVSTPVGYMVRREWDDVRMNEEHYSGWYLEDFTKYFNVIDCEYVKHYKGARSQMLLRIEGTKEEARAIVRETIRAKEEA